MNALPNASGNMYTDFRAVVNSSSSHPSLLRGGGVHHLVLILGSGARSKSEETRA